MANPKVTLREELIFILNQASELEHSLTCSYLFTALSLKDRIEDGLNEETLAAVRNWKGVFTEIAIDEMMHLAIVNSLLVAVGGAPNFDRPNFPHNCAYFMPDLVISLQPFSQKTVQHFIAVEQPLGGDAISPNTPDAASQVDGDLDNEIGADPYVLDSQGDLYGLIAGGLRNLALRLGEENLFIGPESRPAFVSFMESCGWRPVTGLQSALHAVARIVEQGEGASGDNPDSHYWKFRRIHDEFVALKQKYPDFEPAYPVLENPFARTPPEQQGAVNLIDDEYAIQISDLFNEAYTSFLLVLGRFFALTDESDEEATALAEASFWLMKQAILPLGGMLTRMPAGAAHPGLTAGPSFVVRTMHVLPYKNAAWRLLRERFEELAVYTDNLAGDNPGSSLPGIRDAFVSITAMLTQKTGAAGTAV
ncbi:MAG TPA: ferritin-like domain-containing protein [Dehalococcoidia bacterium]|nr:ferritin-like domain-containing protein [Dehalococcoidia bacterium]